jgi:hypothetical protein
MSLHGTVLKLGVNDAVEEVAGFCVHFVITILLSLYHRSPISKSELIMSIQSREYSLSPTALQPGVGLGLLQEFLPSFPV